MSQTSSPAPGASTHTGLLITLTIIAALGGLLFGYDSAVISGATDSIKQNFVAPLGLAEGARLSLEGFTIAGALWGCLIGGALGGVMAHYLGRRGGLIVAGVLFFVSSLGSAWPESWHRRTGLRADAADQCPALVPESVLRRRSLHRIRRTASPTSSAIASSAAWASASPRCSRPCTSPRSRRPPSAARWSPTSRSRSSAASRFRTS